MGPTPIQVAMDMCERPWRRFDFTDPLSSDTAFGDEGIADVSSGVDCVGGRDLVGVAVPEVALEAVLSCW